MPSVSVIVPVRNESRSIERTLRSLLTQDFPPNRFEVIVADGFSQDDTVLIVRRLQGEFHNLKLVYNPSRLSSAARNTSIRHMTGEYAVIVDGHCHIPDRDYLKNLVEAFETKEADALGRPQPLDVPSPTSFQAAAALARSSRIGHNPDSDIFSDQAKFVEPQNTAIAYRREVFHRVGLFDQKFDACEDVEFNTRVHSAGLKCWFEPALKVVYHPRTSFVALVKQLSRYGCGRARLAAKHPNSLTIPALIPSLWMIWLIIGSITAIAIPGVIWLFAASILLYASVILGVSLGKGSGPSVTLRMPLVFVGVHFGFGWGFLRECIRARLQTRSMSKNLVR